MRTVLVVDDERLVVALIARALIDAGWRVITTSRPEEALKVCRSSALKLDLLLTDVVMPGMNGTELRQKVAEVRPELPVTYMSGYADTPQCDQMVGGGAHVLTKPFGIPALLRTVGNSVRPERESAQ